MATVSSYGSLVGVNVRGHAFVEVVKSNLHDLLRTLVKAIEVDEAWYLERYEDVALAVRDAKFASGKEHYRTSGYFEDRIPREVRVDERWYLSTYPDVERAIAERKFGSAQEHFESDGFREGRLPAEGWRL